VEDMSPLLHGKHRYWKVAFGSSSSIGQGFHMEPEKLNDLQRNKSTTPTATLAEVVDL